ncbi:MAG: metallophosphoesterase family protein [Bacillus sp. (in: firmicutes)]
MERAFVVSDIHGCYTQFAELLENWDKSMKLFILGDLIDRGEGSKQVVQKVMELKAEYQDQVTVLKGNHEDMFLNFLHDPEKMGALYFFNGGGETVKDMIGEPSVLHKNPVELAQLVKERAGDEVDFLRHLPLYEEFGNVLFVHAGIDPKLSDWKNSTEECFLWTRDMIKHPNQTGKVIVYGHTPTQLIHSDRSSGIWMSEDYSYVNIDGGCAYGGQLNAVVVNENGEIEQTYQTVK